MKLLYAAFVRLPTEKAHGAQIVHSCAALAEQGVEVTLALPGRRSAITEDVFSYYGVKDTFILLRLKVPDFLRLGRAGFLLSSIFFAWRLSRQVRKGGYDVVYSRDKAVLVALRRINPRLRLVWEVHGPEPADALRRLMDVSIVVISQGLKDMLVAQGVPESQVCVAHDGVDLAAFEQVESQYAARQRLGLPQDKKVALYIGRVDGWKGTDTLLDAAALLPNIVVAIIGGEPKQIEVLKARYPQVHFLGFRPYKEIAHNSAAADVLVLPNTAKDETSQRYTSPLKLFTYMAAGKPIVASDLPSIREVISEQEAFLVTPDDPKALAAAVAQALTHADDAATRAAAARRKVSEYTWSMRATRIVNHLNSCV
jgi:glycosyltransferase involved in cell wall biosynthesis